MTETNTSLSKGPSAGRVGLAFAYLVGLVCLFYRSWELVIWYVWFRFDPQGEGSNLSTFGRAKAWTATGFVWLILVAIAGKFVINVFSSRTPFTVLARQVFSAAVMMAVARWICGFRIIFGMHLPPLWDPNYNWLPDFALIPVVAALTLAVLGSLGIRDFFGFPVWQFLPESWRQKSVAWMGNTLVPSKLPVSGGPKRWGSLGGYTSLLWLQWMRTLVVIHAMPIMFGIILLWAAAFLVFGMGEGYVDWDKSNGLLHLIVFALLPFFFIALKRSSESYWTRTGLWVAAIAVAISWLASYGDNSNGPVCDFFMVALPVLAAALSAISVSQNVSKMNWGPANDTRFVGIAVTVPDAFELYFSMCFRMLRPYFVSLVIFAALTYLSVRLNVVWLAIAWPVAALLHAFVFPKLVWYEAVPYHYKNVNPEAANIRDFVESP